VKQNKVKHLEIAENSFCTLNASNFLLSSLSEGLTFSKFKLKKEILNVNELISKVLFQSLEGFFLISDNF